MKFLHTMIRVYDLNKTLDFFVNKLGLKEVRRKDYPKGRFTLIFLATEKGAPEIELTHNWDQEKSYDGGKNFGHLAYEVDDIYQTCERLESLGVKILRPPRDGYMAFIRSPDNISIELLQKGSPLAAKAPWDQRANQGEW